MKYAALAAMLLSCQLACSAQPLRTLPNLRDVGGCATRDGHLVRTGVLFRSDRLVKLSRADLASLGGLGLRKVYDLRTQAEQAAQPDELPSGSQNVLLDVLHSDGQNSIPARLMRLVADPPGAQVALGDGKGMAMMEGEYRKYVTLPSARASYRRLYLDLAHPQSLPALYHCTAGKDRTGWATAALLTFLGVPEETVMRDYLLSNDFVLPKYQKALEAFRARGGNPDLWLPVLGVEREYLETAFAEMRAQYGDIEGYLQDGLGINAADRQALRNRFLETP